MNTRRPTLMAVAAVAAGLLVAPAAGRASSQDRARPAPERVGGLWILNHDESQTMPELPPEKENDRPHPGGGRRGGGMGGFEGFGGFGGRTGERPDESLLAQRRSLMALHRQPPVRFTLVTRTADRAIVFTDADGRVRTLLTDGKKYREPLPDGGAADRVTRWKDDVLVSELRGEGIKLVQQFNVDETGDRLVVTSILEVSARGDQRVSLQRVYDRGDAGTVD